MDSFFKPVPKDPNSPPKRKVSSGSFRSKRIWVTRCRQAEDTKGGAAKKGKGPAGKPAAKAATKGGKGKK